jgi:colicin import membrane protein
VFARSLRRNPGRIRAIVYAVLVHAVVIGLIVIGFRWTIAPSTDQVIQAVAVPEQAARKPEVVDKRAKDEEEARKKAEAEKRRQAEVKKKQDEEQAQQRLLAERKKKEAEEKEQQIRAAELERKNSPNSHCRSSWRRRKNSVPMPRKRRVRPRLSTSTFH